MDELVYVDRGSYGLKLNRGILNPVVITSLSLDPKTNICRSLKFSNNGQYLCYCDSSRTVLVETSTGKEVYSMSELSKTQQIEFSPQDSTMITYEPYVIYGSRNNPDGTAKKPKPNLNFHSVSKREHMKVFVVQKQALWRPQFTEDESKMLRLSDQGLLIHEHLNLEKYEKVPIKNLESFSVSPGKKPHIICFSPGVNGQPAFIQLRELSTDLPVKFTKTSFNCDKCAVMWNAKGTAVLITASVDVDKTNQSYYGVSHLYCITVKMDCFQVHLNKPGPLHSVQWSPNGKEFCVCYGFMPSKVTIFNIKGDVVWDLLEDHKNEIHYSPFGDVLVTCGFGNISSGKMNFWNLETKKEIIQHVAALTTHFEWAPDGRHFLTATTAPRLRTSNGYRLWNYGKGVMYEKQTEKDELWQVSWKPIKTFMKPAILNLTTQERNMASSHGGGVSVQKTPIDNLPRGAVTKSGVYVPPAMRKQAANNTGNTRPAGDGLKSQIDKEEKKILSIQKKLDKILKLRDKKDSGGSLELNQIEMMQNENQLREELERLKSSKIV